MKYIMGIDEGTTGCKAALFDQTGEQIAIASREYSSYFPYPGWVEQDIEEIRNSVFEACKEAIDISLVDPQQIVGVSHSNQGITMVLLDENEQPVSNRTIGWQDLRYTDVLQDVQRNVDLDEYWQLSGMTFGTYNISVLNWLQEREQEVWARVERCCSHQDYFLRQYGADGFYIDEGSANFLSMANVLTNEWDERLMRVYNVKQSMLPTIVHKPGKVVGYVNGAVSAATGLPIGCTISLGGLDTNCCTIGAGAKDAGTEILIMGTAGVSILISDRMILDPNRRITVRSNPGFGNWQYYIMTNTGASAFRWFRDQLCSMEIATGRLMGMDPYDIITATAARSKPGANGVTALTSFQGSHTRVKNEKTRGSFFGIHLGTTKADIAQAILEGICFEMKDVLQMKKELAGDIKTVRLCGGVAKSERWSQMFANILERPVELTEVSEVGCLGAAMCAGIGAGLFKDLSDAMEKCVRVARTYVPNDDVTGQYSEVYQRWTKYHAIANAQIYV